MTVSLFTREGGSIYALSSEVLVAYLNLPVKLEFVTKDGNKAFEEIFPENNRYTPSIYDSQSKFTLNQQVAVNRYLLTLARDTKKLLGSKPNYDFEILQWTSRIDSDILKKVLPLYIRGFRGELISDVELFEYFKNLDVRGIDVLEAHLTQHTYLVGESLTLADIEGASLIGFFLVADSSDKPGLKYIGKHFNEEWRKAHPAITRWLSTIHASKPFTDRITKQAAAAKKQEKKQQKKEKPAAAAAAPAEEKEQKYVHPLSLLGKSSIPIDQLKRTYSNEVTREVTYPWFWNTFYNDDEWSLWKVDYKYNDELTQTFMSNNLIGGFFNRLSASTKYIFGAAVVYGENNNNGIRGAFVIRGKDYLPAFDVAPDCESFEFTRMDASNPKDREEIEDLWAWDKPLIVNGESREIADGKVFK